jgi:hypothetical protein
MPKKPNEILEDKIESSAEQSPAIETSTEQLAEQSLTQNETTAEEKRPPKPSEVILIPAKKVTKQ